MYVYNFSFLNDTATPEIYAVPPRDALPICRDRAPGPAERDHRNRPPWGAARQPDRAERDVHAPARARKDRKSTRLNSSHANTSYAVFCLKKNNYTQKHGDHEQKT